MARDEFESWRKRNAIQGQRRLATTIRTLIYQADPALFDRLDFSSDAQFLHPVLFAYFTDPSPQASLPQTLYGLTPPERRPASIEIRTDAAGRVFLGTLGTIEMALRSTTLSLSATDANILFRCLSSTEFVPFHVRPPQLVPGTQIEVMTDIHPLFWRFFGEMDGPRFDAGVVRLLQDHIPCLMAALALMRAHCPAVWKEITAFIRLIVLYRATTPNSFAALSAHGAIFCNVGHGEDEVTLLEDVTHQAAHVVFNALASDPKRLLAVDPYTPVQTLSASPGETRTLYEAMHGLFTYTLICQVLTGVHSANVLPGRQAHEVLGRLGFTLMKFASDLARLDLPAAFTPVGRRCYDAFAAEFEHTMARYGALVADLSYDNQPYAFDYLRFVARNGSPSFVGYRAAS